MNQAQQLQLKLQKIKLNTTLNDIVSLSFEVKADIYSYLLAGINPGSKLISLVNDCSRTILPSRVTVPANKRADTYTKEDYQNSFYNLLIVEPEVSPFLCTAEDIMNSKDTNLRLMAALADKYQPEKAQQSEVILTKLKSPRQSSSHLSSKQSESKLNEKVNSLSSLPQKPTPKQPQSKPIQPTQKDLQKPTQQKPEQKQSILNFNIEQLLKLCPDKPEKLQTVYTEQLFLKQQAILQSYQGRLEPIVQSLTSLLPHVPAATKQQINEFLTANEMDFDDFLDKFEKMKQKFGVEDAFNREKAKIGLKRVKKAAEEGDLADVMAKIEEMEKWL